MKLDSLRWRFIASGGFLLLGILVAGHYALVAVFERHVERRLIAEMGRHLDQLTASLGPGARGGLTVTRELTDPRFDTPLSGLYWQVDAGQQRLRSRSLWDSVLAPTEAAVGQGLAVRRISGPKGETLIAAGRTVTLAATEDRRAVRLVVASDLTELRDAIAAFAGDARRYMALMAALLVAGGAVQIMLGLKPLTRLRQRVAEIAAGRVERMGDAYPAEVRPLAKEIDKLLEARERSMALAKGRAADLAHGLRTPLQVLEGDLARLKAKGEHAIATDIGAIADGMRRHVERELARARAGYGQAGARADVGTCIQKVAAVARRIRDDVEVTTAADAYVLATIDPDDLTEALGNLVENAVRFARTTVAIDVRAGHSMVEIAVRDDGPGFSPEMVADAKRRGKRLDERGGSAGLGLAITEELAGAWSGSLELSPSPKGLIATLKLPAA